MASPAQYSSDDDSVHIPVAPAAPGEQDGKARRLAALEKARAKAAELRRAKSESKRREAELKRKEQEVAAAELTAREAEVQARLERVKKPAAPEPGSEPEAEPAPAPAPAKAKRERKRRAPPPPPPVDSSSEEDSEEELETAVARLGDPRETARKEMKQERNRVAQQVYRQRVEKLKDQMLLSSIFP